MATFNTKKTVTTSVHDLSGAVEATKKHFEGNGYTVEASDSSYGYFISMTKGGVFRTVLGMRTSLNVDVVRISGGVSIEAKVGIFAQQAIPTLIMMFIAWPVLLTQITGLVQQSKLDDEVVSFIEDAIIRCGGGNNLHVGQSRQFCPQCGADIASDSRFCSACGAKQ